MLLESTRTTFAPLNISYFNVASSLSNSLEVLAKLTALRGTNKSSPRCYSVSSSPNQHAMKPKLTHHSIVCPHCCNVLTVSEVPHTSSPGDTAAEFSGQNRMECRTCPYQFILTKRFYERKEFKRPEREDVFGGPQAWDNAQKGEVQCPKEGCDGMEAAFFQVQIRSADEPMTSFYKVCYAIERTVRSLKTETLLIRSQCMTCHNRWREN